jgi:hypothetical protein
MLVIESVVLCMLNAIQIACVVSVLVSDCGPNQETSSWLWVLVHTNSFHSVHFDQARGIPLI